MATSVDVNDHNSDAMKRALTGYMRHAGARSREELARDLDEIERSHNSRVL